MSNSTDDNTLFSQDDIDKLLNAQSIEEAEENINNQEDESAGELSQDDIDKLLNAKSVEDDDSNNQGGSLPELAGELSQDDIDKLLNAVSDFEPEETEPVLDEEPEFDPPYNGDNLEDDEDDDLGELSQDDIDRLLNSSSDTDDKIPDSDDIESDNIKLAPPSAKDKNSDDDGIFDLISQDDIDKLMSTDMPDDQFFEPENVMPDLDEFDSSIENQSSNNLSQEDIIDSSEAWDVKDCFITQDTLDNLLNEFDEEDSSSKESFNLKPQTNTQETVQVNLSEDDPDFNISKDDNVSANDLDALLNESSSDIEDNFVNDISMDDIDGFLKEGYDESLDSLSNNDNIASSKSSSEDSPKNIISQDDIDALLAGTDEEDEDILSDMEIDQELNSAPIPAETLGSALHEDDEVHVHIEEEPDEAHATLADGTVRQIADFMDDETEEPSKKNFVFKVILAVLFVIILIAGCVAGAYFFFFKDKIDKMIHFSEPAVQTENVEQDINIQESDELNPGTITLEHFIVFAPKRNDGVTYISLDITIDYSYSKVIDTINNKLPYYRAVIYEAINNAVQSDISGRLTESDLLEIVKKTLRQELPDMKLDNILFVNFKTG